MQIRLAGIAGDLADFENTEGLEWLDGSGHGHIEAAIFVLFGFSFYMLHNNIQVHVTDLSQTARGAACRNPDGTWNPIS